MPASERPPSKRAVWPPKGFAYAQAVSGPRASTLAQWWQETNGVRALNWWSLAWAVGRNNPWDLIIYNFETEDPHEVNWYLREYVGCKITIGNNYVFDDANPGIVYIPHSSWRPPAKYKKGSSRRSYSDDLAKQVTVIIRRAVPVCPWVIGWGYSINRGDLLRVAKWVETKKIHCRITPEIIRLGAHGQYYNGDIDDYFKGNTLHLGKMPSVSSMDMVATVAHESVHAVFDARKEKNLYVGQDEMIAFAVDSIISARLFRRVVESRLSSGKHEDHALLFFGWHLTQTLNPYKFVNLELLKMEPKVHDPFRGTDVQIYDDLLSYVHSRYKAKWYIKKICDGL